MLCKGYGSVGKARDLHTQMSPGEKSVSKKIVNSAYTADDFKSLEDDSEYARFPGKAKTFWSREGFETILVGTAGGRRGFFVDEGLVRVCPVVRVCMTALVYGKAVNWADTEHACAYVVFKSGRRSKEDEEPKISRVGMTAVLALCGCASRWSAVMAFRVPGLHPDPRMWWKMSSAAEWEACKKKMQTLLGVTPER